MTAPVTGLKTAGQLTAMRQAGKILAQIFSDIKGFVEPGLSELEVEAFVAKKITEYGATATYKEPDPNFPAVVCISTNEQIVHGVPTDYVFEEGDIASFDLVITYKDMKVDSAFTMVVGEVPKGAKKHLLSLTEKSLTAGIAAIHGDGTTTGDIGAAVEAVLNKGRLGIVRDLVGHGVGLEMHMPPDIPNYGKKGSGDVLRAGDTIAIEPMATLGGERTTIDEDDGWTISTRDSSLAAHFEHTVLITEDGAEILTSL